MPCWMFGNSDGTIRGLPNDLKTNWIFQKALFPNLPRNLFPFVQFASFQAEDHGKRSNRVDPTILWLIWNRIY
jgi:hypothetical protein